MLATEFPKNVGIGREVLGEEIELPFSRGVGMFNSMANHYILPHLASEAGRPKFRSLQVTATPVPEVNWPCRLTVSNSLDWWCVAITTTHDGQGSKS